jgi:group I intron endonuclease
MEYKLFEIKLNTFKGQSGIYRIRIKNRCYIGSSKDIPSRLADHKQRLVSGKHSNPIIGACFNKYGKDECYVSILEETSIDKLLIREKHFIDILKPELNCELDPTNQQNCITTSKVVYQFDLDGNFISEYCSAKEAERQLGILAISHAARTDSKSSKYKSAGGFLWSYEKDNPPKYFNGSSKSKIRKVYMYDVNGNQIKSFDSIADAAREIIKEGDNHDSLCSKISSNCRNAFVYEVYDYHFSYNDLEYLPRHISKRKAHKGT